MRTKNTTQSLTDKEKLAAILQFLQLKIADFAKKLDINPDHLYNLNSGKINEFSQEVRKSILNTYQEINPQWLLTGDGNMIRQDHNTTETNGGNNVSGILAGSNIKQYSYDQNIERLITLLESKDRQIEKLISIIEKNNLTY